MKKLLILTALALLSIAPASAQAPASGARKAQALCPANVLKIFCPTGQVTVCTAALEGGKVRTREVWAPQADGSCHVADRTARRLPGFLVLSD